MEEGLGFKDLKAINLTMLSEQYWRLLELGDTILQIVLVQDEDNLIWKFERNDSYLVQFGYNWLSSSFIRQG